MCCKKEAYTPVKPPLTNGTYETAAGSQLKVTGKHAGIYTFDLDWVEEEEACFDCEPHPVPDYDTDEVWMRWDCVICGGGAEKLIRKKG